MRSQSGLKFSLCLQPLHQRPFKLCVSCLQIIVCQRKWSRITVPSLWHWKWKNFWSQMEFVIAYPRLIIQPQMVKSSELWEPSKSQWKPWKLSREHKQRNWYVSFWVIVPPDIRPLDALQLNSWWGEEFALGWTLCIQICQLECLRSPNWLTTQLVVSSYLETQSWWRIIEVVSGHGSKVLFKIAWGLSPTELWWETCFGNDTLINFDL